MHVSVKIEIRSDKIHCFYFRLSAICIKTLFNFAFENAILCFAALLFVFVQKSYAARINPDMDAE